MTTGTALGTSLVGLECHRVTVRAKVEKGSSKLTIRGLPEPVLRETRVRVLSALGTDAHSVDVELDGLPPGGDTSALDLPIAVAIMRALGRPTYGKQATFIGELGLDGSVKPVRGALVRAESSEACVVPFENAWEAGLSGKEVFASRSITQTPEPVSKSMFAPRKPGEPSPFQRLIDEHGRKSRLLLMGAPGSGKTLLARGIAASLPPLSVDEQLEVARLYGAAGLIGWPPPMTAGRPFRAPHHTVSEAGLLGGGQRPRPGEASLAHRGVLMLDELPEFRRSALNDLGHVLSSKFSRLYRNGELVSFPAEPACVVATANPCPCGYLNHPRRACHCSGEARGRHMLRLQELAELLEVKTWVSLPAVQVLT